MNRNSVLACIQRHLRYFRGAKGDDSGRYFRGAKGDDGGLRPLGELIPQIAAELRAGIDISGVQVSVTAVPLVAAFIDGVVSPQEEFAVCQAILVDNSVVAELVAGVLALEEVQPHADPLPGLSNDLATRLLEITSQAFSTSAIELADAEEHVVAPEHSKEQVSTLIPARKPVSTRSKSKWLQPALAAFAVAACLLLIVWWTLSQAGLRNGRDEVVRVPSQPEVRDPFESSQDELPQPVRQSASREDGLAVQTPNGNPTLTPQSPIELSPLETPPPEMPQVAAVPPAPSLTKPDEFIATPIKSLQWKKISGLLAQRTLNPDYSEEFGWKGVTTGGDDELKAADATQWLTLPMSRAEADIASGGSLVLAADTRLSLTQGGQSTSAKVSLAHGLIAFVDMPRNTSIEFTDNDQAIAVIKWGATKSTLIMTVTDAGLQAQVTGGEVSINQQSVRNRVVSIDSQSVNELKDRNTRLPAWVSRPVENIPVSKAILGQLAGADNLSEMLDRHLEAGTSAGEADMLTIWRASLSDSNLLRTAESRSPLVRIQALQRLVALPEWDVRYKQSWQRFATTINNEAELMLLRHSFDSVRQGGKLNVAQIAQLVKLLESPQFAVRSLSDFILRNNFGGGPQFDPNPQSNTRGIGLWKRYISALRNNAK